MILTLSISDVTWRSPGSVRLLHAWPISTAVTRSFGVSLVQQHSASTTVTLEYEGELQAVGFQLYRDARSRWERSSQPLWSPQGAATVSASAFVGGKVPVQLQVSTSGSSEGSLWAESSAPFLRGDLTAMVVGSRVVRSPKDLALLESITMRNASLDSSIPPSVPELHAIRLAFWNQHRTPSMGGASVPGWALATLKLESPEIESVALALVHNAGARRGLDSDALRMRARSALSSYGARVEYAQLVAEAVQSSPNFFRYLPDTRLVGGLERDVESFSRSMRHVGCGDCEDSAIEMMYWESQLRENSWESIELQAARHSLRLYVLMFCIGAVPGPSLGGFLGGGSGSLQSHAFSVMLPASTLVGALSGSAKLRSSARACRLQDADVVDGAPPPPLLVLDGTGLKHVVEDSVQTGVLPGIALADELDQHLRSHRVEGVGVHRGNSGDFYKWVCTGIVRKRVETLVDGKWMPCFQVLFHTNPDQKHRLSHRAVPFGDLCRGRVLARPSYEPTGQEDPYEQLAREAVAGLHPTLPYAAAAAAIPAPPIIESLQRCSVSVEVVSVSPDWRETAALFLSGADALDQELADRLAHALAALGPAGSVHVKVRSEHPAETMHGVHLTVLRKATASRWY